MRILLTNDDGINAPGLIALADELKRVGELLIVAPERERSGSGHAITHDAPLRVKEVRLNHVLLGYATTGTTVDAVKLGLEVLSKARIDWIVSGINAGGNIGIDLFYSGTVSGAIEGTINGYPAMAFSLYRGNQDRQNLRFRGAAQIAREIFEAVVERGLPRWTCLNVNIPNLERDAIAGIEITEQALGHYADAFELRTDPRGFDYYWMKGQRVSPNSKQRDDAQAIEERKVTITPIQIDLTDFDLLERMRRWNLRLSER
ncbi:MAG: 5'/3'-nucleotidase SurE [Candidatus Bipolaricaulia bacterium]